MFVMCSIPTADEALDLWLQYYPDIAKKLAEIKQRQDTGRAVCADTGEAILPQSLSAIVAAMLDSGADSWLHLIHVPENS